MEREALAERYVRQPEKLLRRSAEASRSILHRAPVILIFVFVLVPVGARGQSFRIAIVDFYGVRQTSEAAARSALTIKEGDTIALAGEGRPAFVEESERRLSALPGVRRAHVGLVCCDEGGAIVYVGLEENNAPVLRFRDAPRGGVRLPPAVVQAGRDFSAAVTAAILRGDTADDWSRGHSLMHDPAARAIQERFIEYARDRAPLAGVLRHSSNPEHRALAAEILGYAPDKRDVIGDLVYALNDPSSDVRNDATRALVAIAQADADPHRAAPRIPIAPIVRLLHSPIWTDRNKASLALMNLSAARDRDVLATLRTQAIVPLVEMARWKNSGHAMPALLILGRIAGQSDDEVETAWKRGNREIVISAALARATRRK